jgi:hypothetical protein
MAVGGTEPFYVDQQGHISNGRMRLDQHPAKAAERLGAGGHDLDLEQRFTCLARGHLAIDHAGGGQLVVQAIEDRRRGRERRQQTDERTATILVGHGRLHRGLSLLPPYGRFCLC